MKDSTKKMWANIVEYSVVIALGLGLLYLIILGVSSDDTDYWNELDNNSPVKCYVHEINHNNGWLTPGHTWHERNTYCLSNVE